MTLRSLLPTSLPAALRWLALVLLPVAGTLRAQSKAPEADLRTLRASFRQALLSAILPEKRAYATQLRDLEKRLAAARDYEAAMKVRDERLALEQELTAFEQELPALAARAAGQTALLPERIPLPAKDAVLSGLRLETDGAITGWNAPQATATWKLPSLPPGGYEVIARYACGGTAPVAVEVRESFYLLHGKLPGSGDKVVEKNLGTLRVRDGSGTLVLAPEATAPPAPFRLIALELAPVNR